MPWFICPKPRAPVFFGEIVNFYFWLDKDQESDKDIDTQTIQQLKYGIEYECIRWAH